KKKKKKKKNLKRNLVQMKPAPIAATNNKENEKVEDDEFIIEYRDDTMQKKNDETWSVNEISGHVELSYSDKGWMSEQQQQQGLKEYPQQKLLKDLELLVYYSVHSFDTFACTNLPRPAAAITSMFTSANMAVAAAAVMATAFDKDDHDKSMTPRADMDTDDDNKTDYHKLGRAITRLWKLFAIQYLYKHRGSFFFCFVLFVCFGVMVSFFFFLRDILNNNEHNKHFFAEVVFSKDYVPKEMDVLKCYVRTTGVLEASYAVQTNLWFNFFDLGGERNERKKWIYNFENVDTVIFVAALNHYCQVLFEDQSKNGLTPISYYTVHTHIYTYTKQQQQ
ncbi:guanine nucleotide-binding protein subunit alpha, partial [Reticulomyxa filosa]